jgi:hypothetical protein
MLTRITKKKPESILTGNADKKSSNYLLLLFHTFPYAVWLGDTCGRLIPRAAAPQFLRGPLPRPAGQMTSDAPRNAIKSITITARNPVAVTFMMSFVGFWR